MSYKKFYNDISSNFHVVIARAPHHCQKEKELSQ